MKKFLYLIYLLFFKNTPEEILDARNLISPKKQMRGKDNYFTAYKYAQVFEEKNSFLPNLSILDLLFFTGPQAGFILEKSTKE